MHSLLKFLAIIIVASVIGAFIYTDPGYVLFSYDDIIVEMPFWMLLTSLILLVLLGYIVWAIFNWLFNIKSKVANYYIEYKHKSAKSSLKQAVECLINKDLVKAEKSLVKGFLAQDINVLNYYVAATVAVQRKDQAKLEKYFSKIIEQEPEIDKELLELFLVEMYWQMNMQNQALSKLDSLVGAIQEHKDYPRLAYAIYRKAKQWSKVIELLPRLSNVELREEGKTADEVIIGIYHAFLESHYLKDDFAMIIDYWANIPKKAKKANSLGVIYVNSLLAANSKEHALNFLETKLKEEMFSDFLPIYLELSSDFKRKIEFLDKMVSKYNQNNYLLLSYAKFQIVNLHPQRAKELLQISLGVEHTMEVYALLAKVEQDLGDLSAAYKYLEKALEYIR